MNQEILNFCIGKGILLDKKILGVLENLDNFEIAKSIVERILYKYKQKVVSKSFFEREPNRVYEILSSYREDNKKIVEKFFFKLGIIIEEENLSDVKKADETKKDSLGNVNILKVYKNNPKKIEIKDFVKNFRNRFNVIKDILQERVQLDSLISINRIEKDRQFSLIAMIYDKKTTKNGNIILEIEDLTGKASVLVNKSKKEIFEKTNEILLDEVVGLKCSGSKEMIFANDIIFPDIARIELKRTNTDESVAFISDLHVGSDKFLENNFLNFIKWINGEIGNEFQKKEALKIKYLFITGDTIDGVGIYPGQETQLAIKDVNGQYNKLAELLFKIRSDINIILCPGQHDAVRVAEPQPIIGDNYAPSLYLLKNLFLVTNPSLIEIGSDKTKNMKFKVLMYHGASMHGIINNIDFLRIGKGHDHPTEVVKYMLKKRHLAPTHSLTTYTPIEDEDALLIKEIPDIVATGDLHRPEVSIYNGILLIASSCWQSITPFEEKVGNHPDPCKVPVLNLKTREVKVLDFSGDENE